MCTMLLLCAGGYSVMASNQYLCGESNNWSEGQMQWGVLARYLAASRARALALLVQRFLGGAKPCQGKVLAYYVHQCWGNAYYIPNEAHLRCRPHVATRALIHFYFLISKAMYGHTILSAKNTCVNKQVSLSPHSSENGRYSVFVYWNNMAQ